MINKPHVETFGRYTLRAAVLNKVPTARAFLIGGAPGTIAEATGKSIEVAIDELKQKLNSSDAQTRKDRRHDEALDFNVPTEAEFANALSVVKPRAGQLAMLRAHAAAGEAGLTGGELATAADYASEASAAKRYSLLGRAVAEAAECDLPGKPAAPDADPAIGILASTGEARESGDFVWVMHPELRKAVAEGPERSR